MQTAKITWITIGTVLGLAIGSIVGQSFEPLTQLAAALGIGAVLGLVIAYLASGTILAHKYGWLSLVAGPFIGAAITAAARPIGGQAAGVLCGSILGAGAGLRTYRYVQEQIVPYGNQTARRVVTALAALVWLIGIGVLHAWGGLSLVGFVFFSLLFALMSFDVTRVELWAVIGWMGAGFLFVGMSYLEHVHPSDLVYARDRWIEGVMLITLGALQVIQHIVPRVLKKPR